MRCVICIRTGEWPGRLHDVEETETMAKHEMENTRHLIDQEGQANLVHEEPKQTEDSGTRNSEEETK
jgi:hypothetical protein